MPPHARPGLWTRLVGRGSCQEQGVGDPGHMGGPAPELSSALQNPELLLTAWRGDLPGCACQPACGLGDVGVGTQCTVPRASLKCCLKLRCSCPGDREGASRDICTSPVLHGMRGSLPTWRLEHGLSLPDTVQPSGVSSPSESTAPPRPRGLLRFAPLDS